MTTNKRSKVIIGLIASVLTIIGIIYFVDLQEVWLNLEQLSLRTVIIALCVYAGGMGIRAYRWMLIIKLKNKLPIGLVFKGLVYGYMLNQLLPAKAGEFARAEYVHRKSFLGRSFLLGTIAAERVFDMVVVLVFLFVSVAFSDTLITRFQAQWVPIVLVALGTITLVLLMRNVFVIKHATRHLPQKIRIYIDRVLDNLSSSFNVFRSFKTLTITLLLSFLIWLLTCFVFYLIIQDLNITIPLYAYFFIVSAGTFGMIIPSTSANVGVYHAVAMGALMLFMVPKEQALSFAILAHAFDFFPSLFLGGIVFSQKRIIEYSKIKKNDTKDN